MSADKMSEPGSKPGSVMSYHSVTQSQAERSGSGQLSTSTGGMGSSYHTSTAGIGSSHQRVNIVTEAQSVLPSLTSAFSLEAFELRDTDIHMMAMTSTQQPGDLVQSQPHLPTTQDEDIFQLDDIFENPAYTDTVRSTDSTASMLRRSLSVPPHNTSKSQNDPSLRPHARDIFEDYIVLPLEPGGKQAAGQSAAEASSSASTWKSKKEWQQTVAEMLERQDNMDSLQSNSSGAGLLAKTAIAFSRDGRRTFTKVLAKEETTNVGYSQHGNPYKNLLVLSSSFLFIFASYLSLRNLQSSINDQDGLALYALSTVYLFVFIGCIFATTIVQRFRPKRTMLVCTLAFLVYTSANFHPNFYTLIPASALAGFAMANIWTAHATYLTNIAAQYSEQTKKPLFNVISSFNGTFFMLFGISQVLGGVISSSTLLLNSQPSEGHMTGQNGSDVLTAVPSTSISTTSIGPQMVQNHSLGNMTVDLHNDNLQCGADFCYDKEPKTAASVIDMHLIYVLLGIYALFILIGFLLMAFLLDPLEGVLKKSHSSLAGQLTAVFRWFYDFRVLCLLGLMFYTLVEMAFIFGDVTKAFVTCPYGVQLVGYAMVAQSAMSSVSAYMTGKLSRHMPRVTIFLFAGGIHLSLMVVMLLWKPTQDTTWVIFMITGVWGIADGIIFTQIISLLGMIFASNKEPAFAGLKMCQSTGACFNFMIGKYICTRMKIYLLALLLIIGITTYSYLEWKLSQDSKKKKVPTATLR